MLRLAICDDEREQIELLREYLVGAMFRLNLDMDISVFMSGAALLEAAKVGQVADILFLDIKLADSNGIAVANCIREKDRKTLIIFVSGRLDYILKGYEARAFRFIVKPINERTIADVMNQALKELQVDENNSIHFREKGEIIRENLADIIFLEAQNHKIKAVCSDTIHYFYGRLSELEKRLEGNGFVRCQKGYLVNAVRIIRIGKTEILLDNGMHIPLSSNFSRSTKEKFIRALR